MSITNTITKTQDKIVDGVRKNTERMPNISVPSRVSDRFNSDRFPTPGEFADRSFDFAAKVLDNQRSFVTALIEASTKPEGDTNVETKTTKATKKATKEQA